ncbi:MAG: site-specific integrase [Pleurocapsa sp. SU_196_0]|nr:site-specific integrase [Pleurocapsa sp. SU_196_0]
MHIEDWRLERQRTGGSPKNTRRAFEKLRQALDQAVNWQLIALNPARRVTVRVPEPTEVNVWTPDEVVTFLEHPTVRNHRMYAYFHLAIGTGMRPSELLGLRVDSVNLETRELLIEQGSVTVRGHMVQNAPKTEHSRRWLELSEEDCEVVKAHLERRERERRKGRRWQESGLLFVTTNGTPILTRNMLYDLKGLVNRINGVSKTRKGYPKKVKGYQPPPPEKRILSEMTLYGLRHTYGSISNAANMDVKIFGARMGHKHSSFTLDRYVKVYKEHRRAAAISPKELAQRAKRSAE